MWARDAPTFGTINIPDEMNLSLDLMYYLWALVVYRRNSAKVEHIKMCSFITSNNNSNKQWIHVDHKLRQYEQKNYYKGVKSKINNGCFCLKFGDILKQKWLS